MIVLDEHLQSKNLAETIRHWYAGAVINVLDLRPDTVIKDEAIPILMAQQNMPTFVTINATDFWQRIPASEKFCVVCFVLTSSEIVQISPLLRRLLRHTDFDTKQRDILPNRKQRGASSRKFLRRKARHRIRQGQRRTGK